MSYTPGCLGFLRHLIGNNNLSFYTTAFTVVSASLPWLQLQRDKVINIAPVKVFSPFPLPAGEGDMWWFVININTVNMLRGEQQGLHLDQTALCRLQLKPTQSPEM